MRKRTDRFVETELDGEALLMNVDTGTFHGLGETGLAIWRLMDVTPDTDRLIEQLCASYAVDAATCRQEVDRFLARLVEAGYVEQR